MVAARFDSAPSFQTPKKEKDMKAKKVLKALVKSGDTQGAIYCGDSLTSWKKLEGKLVKQKEYFCTFHKMSYLNADAVLLTPTDAKLYLYMI